MIESLVAELKEESKATAALLEVLPEDKFGWHPHPKSMCAGILAEHIAKNPAETGAILKEKTFAVESMSPISMTCSSTEELMSIFQASLQEGIATLQSFSESDLQEEWSLTRDGVPIMAASRGVVVRSFMFSHVYHHRGQLSVYLRLLDVPVPSVYGPTADVNPFG